MHVGVSQCHVTCVLLSCGARLSCARLCLPVLALLSEPVCLNFVWHAGTVPQEEQLVTRHIGV